MAPANKRSRLRTCRWLLVAVLSVLVALIAIFLGLVQSWAVGTTGNLMGEVVIETAADAHNYAEQFVQEALDFWNEPASNWQVMYNSSTTTTTTKKPNSNAAQVVVEARRITQGPFATSGILLTRGKAVLTGTKWQTLTAQQVFDFMVSPAGFAVIDPASDPADFAHYVERYDGWRGAHGGNNNHQTRLEVADSYIRELPGPVREFVVLNCIDHTDRVFVSKSIVHKDRPGSSVYCVGHHQDVDSQQQPKGRNNIRAINTFALQVHPVNDGIQILLVNYADVMVGPAALANWINCKVFLPGIIDRLEKQAVNVNETA